ncbi:MFS transporter [Deinococcus ficus]|uniref:MFS transporter n=1 Tax=Deinococcus ficus TaxID=317577 RepID=A0A221T3G4_9DEIO|nr:MFS transporter [Deinococcus ficus]ASN83433.1 MFS transporter [Deinococcus ficus]
MTELHRARTATWLLFLFNGILFASWAAQIPRMTERHDLNHQTLGVMLLLMTLGNLLAIRPTNAALRRMTTGQVGLIGISVMSAGLLLLTIAPTVPLLMGGILVLGAGFAATDLGMNRAGARLEEALGTPIMSGLHGAFSVGIMAGAGLFALIVSQNVGLLPAFAGLGALCIALTAALLPLHQRTLDPAVNPPEDGPSRAAPSRGIPLILTLGLCAALIEGLINDWSTLYMGDVLGSSEQAAPLGLAAFGLMMTVGRLIGDGLTRAFGPVILGTLGSLMTAAGLGLLLKGQGEAVGLGGFALVGLGISVLAPLMFSAAGRHPNPAAMTGLITVFYCGFLVGPAVMGLLSAAVGLHLAFVLPLALAVLSAALWTVLKTPVQDGGPSGAPSELERHPQRLHTELLPAPQGREDKDAVLSHHP